MPLHKIEQIKDSRYIAIWQVTENADELREQLTLSPDDAELLTTFRSEKKVLEWLAGRNCLRALCQHLNLPYCGVRKNSNGKPFLKNSQGEISLTHSFPYVAAIIDSTCDVGIDLEQPKEKLLRIAHKFLSEDEQVTASDDVKKLCIYWCAKETMYKICDQKISFKNHMQIEPFEIKGRGHLIGKVIANGTVKSYKLEFRIENDYILTFNV